MQRLLTYTLTQAIDMHAFDQNVHALVSVHILHAHYSV